MTASPLIGPWSLVQGTIPADRRPLSLLRVRRLEAAVLSADRGRLVHYYRDQTRPDRPWVAGEVISERAAGPGAIAQEAGRLRDPGALHVLVPEHAPGGGVVLGHHVRRNARGLSHRWHRVGEVAGESAALWADSGRVLADVVADGVGRVLAWSGAAWEPAAGARPPAGPPGPPVLADAVTVTGSGLAGLPGGDWLAGLPGGDGGLAWPATSPAIGGWLQALVQQGESLHQWHRQEWRGRVRWTRAACLRFHPGEPFGISERSSRKLAQVTGERDTQPGGLGVTLSASESRSGIRGTDLGVRVDHAGTGYLLFGDSHWTRRGRSTRDAIGRVTEAGPVPGLPGVELHGAPLAITGGVATCREYDVPLDAFSAGGRLFALFTSHHFQRHQVMGRSVLTRAREVVPVVTGAERRRPVRFAKIATFSDRFFVNVSAQRRGDRVYLWGSGSYRADDLRLAELDLAAPTVRAALHADAPWTRPLPGLRYWAGRHPGDTRWSAHEEDATPVVRGAFGELSVRWVDEMDAYVLLAMDGPEDPIGRSVTLRTAPAPWGPWSSRLRLFDWEADGKSPHDEASRFIRAHMADDPVGDRIFATQGAMTGGAYAPYLFDARRDGDDVVLRYTLSTWNPYQVVLMEHRLAAPLRGAASS